MGTRDRKPARVELPKQYNLVAHRVGKGGRRHQYLTLEQEQQFLAPFFAQAQAGTISTAVQIKRAFEALGGQEVAECIIHRLLNRHGWRKLVPRPVHPKADPDEQATFKKL